MFMLAAVFQSIAFAVHLQYVDMMNQGPPPEGRPQPQGRPKQIPIPFIREPCSNLLAVQILVFRFLGAIFRFLPTTFVVILLYFNLLNSEADAVCGEKVANVIAMIIAVIPDVIVLVMALTPLFVCSVL